MDLDKTFLRFVGITRRLRQECPWDKKQTHESIRQHLIEEAYEVVETIDQKRWQELKGELGDLLLHVVFHANIAEERKEFTLDEVIEAISEKLIRRHPHIYGTEAPPGSAEEVKGNWEKIKLQEGRKSLLDGVPKHLPALLRASRLTERAATVGFDWKKKEDAWKKVEEEITELHRAVESGTTEEAGEELGDLLFGVVNYARFLGVNPELALLATTEKFTSRFRFIEEELKGRGRSVHDSTLEEMDELWNEAKRRES